MRLAIAASAIVVYVLLCSWTWPFTMDDSFISFRYAKHIGEGIGPVWNLADRGQPIEGFTSFLYVWLLGVMRFASGIDVVLAGKLVGIGSGLLLGLCIARATQRFALRPLAAVVALSVMMLPFMALNSVSGMETTFFMLWNFLCATSCLRLLETPTRSRTWIFVLFGLLGTLTRPEFAPAFLLMCAYAWWQQPAARRWLLEAFVAAYVLPGVIVTGWRYSYYGQLVPYPFYAKQSSGLSGQGVLYVIRFWWLLVLPYAILLATGWRNIWSGHRHLLALLSLNLGFACVYFSTAKPMMGWWFRFLLPQVPLLALAAAVALNGRESTRSRSRSSWRVAAASLLVVTNLIFLPVITRFLEFHKLNEDRYREIGRRLRPLAADDRWLMYMDVGSIVYEAEWNTIDEVSLNTDRKLRVSPCVNRPDIVLRISKPGHDTENPCDAVYDLFARLPFLKQDPIVNSHMDVYARKDLSYADALRRHLVDGWPDRLERPTNWMAHYVVRLQRIDWMFPAP